MSVNRPYPHTTLISLLVTTFVVSCGGPVKTPYRAPSLSDQTGGSLIAFQEDFVIGGSDYEGAFEDARFQGYRYAAPDGVVLSVELVRLSGDADPVLIMYGPQRASGVWGEAARVSDDSRGAVNPTMRVGPLQGGTYLFVVTTREYPSTGRFRVRLRCLTGCSDEPACTLSDVCPETICYSGFVSDDAGCPTCECRDECREDRECGPQEACLRGQCEAYCQCSNENAPVCGADGVSYRNRCEAGCAGVEVTSDGECREDCPAVRCDLTCRHGYVRDADGCETCECQSACDACTAVQEPVCTRNGQTYTNQCLAECVGESIAYAGECRDECSDIMCDLDCPNGYQRDGDGCFTCECVEPECVDTGGQVCGANGVTYSSECEAGEAGVRVVFEGACPPLCGGNADCPSGYTCQSGIYRLPECDPADASCIALCVKQAQRCEPDDEAVGVAAVCGPDETCSRDGQCRSDCDCSDVYYPVCGADGQTYDNACRARCADITTWRSGTCCDVSEVDRCELRCAAGFAVDANGCGQCECATDVPVECACDRDLVNPICASDGEWYCNECLLRCAGVSVSDSEAVCERSSLTAACRE